MKGIRKTDPQKKVRIISDEAEAIRHAAENAQHDALIFVCSDDIKNSLELIRELKETDEEKLVDHES